MRFMKFTGVLAVLVLAGCATHMDKTFQKVHISTPGVAEAECIVTTPHNKYQVITPAHVNVERSENSLVIHCEKGNYYPAGKTVEATINLKHQILNVWNGILPGLVYDTASNAIYHYPKEIAIPMEQDPYAVLATAYTEEPPAPPLRRKDEGYDSDDLDVSDMAPVAITPADTSFSNTLRK